MLSELAESIKEFGIVTPIITRPKEDGNGYEVIAGQPSRPLWLKFFIRCACESEGVASSLSIVANKFSCSSFFKKDTGQRQPLIFSFRLVNAQSIQAKKK